MAKRPDHGQDATQELSASQLLRDLPPAKPPRPKVPVNDVSMWGRKVVGTEEFAPAPTQRAPRSRRWAFAAVGALAVAGGGFAIWSALEEGDAPAAKLVEPAAPATRTAPPSPPGKPPVAPPPAVATPAPTATPPPPVAAAAIAPDAISSVAPVIPVKPAAGKRPVNKTAAATKRPLKKPIPKKPPPKRRTR